MADDLAGMLEIADNGPAGTIIDARDAQCSEAPNHQLDNPPRYPSLEGSNG
jgi:hypothetical protein